MAADAVQSPDCLDAVNALTHSNRPARLEKLNFDAALSDGLLSCNIANLASAYNYTGQLHIRATCRHHFRECAAAAYPNCQLQCHSKISCC